MASTSADFESEDQLKVFRDVVAKENANLDIIVAEKTKQMEEYKALRSRLEDLPKKLTHDIMVPFGKVGFMPGKIVRTNEVMMLLGNDYFVERSCHEANECIDRRLEVIDKTLKDCEANRNQLAEDLKYAEQLFGKGDEVEIVEQYDETQEEEMKQKRRDQLAKASALKSANSENISQNELDIMRHLEEMELAEQENGELDEDEETTGKIPCPPGISEKEFHQLLCRLDEEDTSEEDYESEEEKEGDMDSDDIPESEEEKDEKTQIKEAKPERKRSVRFSEVLEKSTTIRVDDPVSVIKPASDSNEATGPILRNRDMKSPCDTEALKAMKEAESRPRVIPGSQTAFSGLVVERQVDVPEDSTPTENQPSKPVSKFKMQRMKR